MSCSKLGNNFPFIFSQTILALGFVAFGVNEMLKNRTFCMAADGTNN